MLILTRALIVFGLLLGGSAGSAERIANQLTAQINTMQRVQEQACASAGVCENEPIGSAIQTMLRLQQRLRIAAGDPEPGDPPADPGNGPGANGPMNPGGPNGLKVRTVRPTAAMRVHRRWPIW